MRRTVGGRGAVFTNPESASRILFDLPRMFESGCVPSFRFVAHQLSASRRCSENIAGPRDAVADGLRIRSGEFLIALKNYVQAVQKGLRCKARENG